MRPALAILLAWLAPSLLWAAAPPVYDYRVLDQKPQPRENFVQGLQIVDGALYVSTGGYGESKLLRYRLSDGKLQASRRLHPRLFGEGLAVVGERIYQLTWRSRLGLVYDRASFDLVGRFSLPGQGWGLTWDGRRLIYSDGSDRLFFVDPDNGQITGSVAVRAGGVPVTRLNELEWIDGEVWANVWQTDAIVIIDPDSGEVTRRLDLGGLLPDSEREAGTDVLNGIARDPDTGAIWVTGKRWPWLYRIEPVPREAP